MDPLLMKRRTNRDEIPMVCRHYRKTLRNSSLRFEPGTIGMYGTGADWAGTDGGASNWGNSGDVHGK